MEATPASLGNGRGRKKLIRDRTFQSPGDNNLKFYVENMKQQQLDEARHAIDENPDVITVIDRNGNTNSIKTEPIDNIHLNETNNQPETNTSRLKSRNPINRYGNPITF